MEGLLGGQTTTLESYTLNNSYASGRECEHRVVLAGNTCGANSASSIYRPRQVF